MDKDKAIRAALLTAKGMDKTSENIADYVADLLRQGREKEITDDLMAQADPQRLHYHYTTGNTGMDMPMDQASRMERAGQMGFDTQKPIYHGSLHPFSSFKIDGPNKTDHGWYGKGSYFGDPETGSIYATNHPTIHNPQGGSVIPAFSRGKTYTWPEGRKIAMDDKEAQDIKESMINQGYSSADIHAPNDPDVWGDDAGSWRERVVYDPTAIRSQFARFDPRLSHLSHLSASTGGAMELARAITAKNRAGGQIAPSKYLPNVPRAVHADGGKVAFQQGNHPLVPDVVYHGTQSDIKTFRQSQTGEFGPGIYTTDLPEEASDYAGTHPFAGKGPNVMPLHLSMKNPFVVKKDPQEFWQKFGGKWDEDVQKNAIAAGHDGVIFRRPYMKWDDQAKREVPTGKFHTHFVAFYPNQVKSAIGNNGKFDPTDPDITKADGGRAGYSNGGKSLGLYSKAAQIIRNQPQAKGNVDQLLAMVSKGKGVKPTELANAGRPASDTMTKEELAQHFEQALPDVQVMRKGRVARNAVNALMQQDRRNWGQEDWDRANALNQEAERQPSSRYDQYTLPGGTNYREHLLHLPEGRGPLAKRRKELQDQWQQAYENQAPKEELDRLGAEFDDLANDEGSDFKSSHWRTPNVLAHVRMDERDNGKTLHVQEVQSDWGQEGREMGFHDPENPFEVVNRKTKEVVSRHPDYRSMTDAWRDHPDRENLNYGDVGDEKPPQGPYVGNTQQWTDLALKHVLTEAAKGGHDRVVFSPGEANADLYGQRKEVQMLKFLKSKDSGEAGILSAYSKDGRRSSEHDIENNAELAKLLGKENAANLLAQPQNPAPEEGDNLYAHRLQGPLQVGGHGMIDYYKNYVHPGALKLLQQHDPSIKPESYDLPGGYKGFSLPMTDTARQSILKNGFQAFQRGGAVDGDEDGITAYHGSPHSFDQFNIANLGTGEGAQAYGHGLYFAGNEKIAKHYKDTLAGGPLGSHIYNDISTYFGGYHPIASRSDVVDAIKSANMADGDVESTLKRLAEKKSMSEWQSDKEDAAGIAQLAQDNAFTKAMSKKYGHMYKVKLNVQPHELLDWDKPLSEQPHVLKAIDSRYGDPEIVMQQLGHDINTATGRDFHDSMAGTVGDNQGAAQRLQDMGFKGIRYLDAGSRDLSDGDPTHNYVMFHHDPVKVTDKYEYGGEVHKATGGPVMGYVPFAPIQIRRLATAPIAPQQSQQSVGRFSQSLGSLMDTVEGFKKKPEETAAAPVATPSPTTEGQAPEQPAYDTTGMSDAASSAYGKLTDAWGQPIGVVSAFRDPEKNQSVGGAEGSQHLHGNAYDIDTSDYSYEDRLRLADAAKAAGFTGFGFYGNNMHLDVGPQRAWGPSYHSDSIPDWARPWVNTNVYADHPRAAGGSVSKALSVTRGFTKDGKSAIGSIKPKRK